MLKRGTKLYYHCTTILKGRALKRGEEFDSMYLKNGEFVRYFTKVSEHSKDGPDTMLVLRTRGERKEVVEYLGSMNFPEVEDDSDTAEDARVVSFVSFLQP